MKLIGNKRSKPETVPRTVPRNSVPKHAEIHSVPRHAEIHSVPKHTKIHEVTRESIREAATARHDSKRRIRIVTASLIVSIILTGFIALAIGVNFHISSLNTIFPNVWAEGLLLSGMTQGEAVQALIEDGYEENADGISVKLVFPDGTYFVLTGTEVGLSLNAEQAAEVAFGVGRERSGSFLQNEITFVRSIFQRTELKDLSTPNLDYSMLPGLAADYTQRFNDTLFDGTLEYDGQTITILKGTGFEPADSNEVFELARSALMQAVDANEHVVVHYIPEARHDNFDLSAMFERINIEPVTSMFEHETGLATPSTIGRTFDLEEALRTLNNAAGGETIVIPIYDVYPEFTQEQIEAMLLSDVLAESSTQIAGPANRLHNIALTAEYINGTVLQHGEIFSFNEVVGMRTRERGFRDAGVFRYGLLVDGLGGGICQTSSTIYDAVLHTRLAIVERHAHSRRISYLPLGHDATIVYGRNMDFRFRNNTYFPLKIESEVEGRTLTVRLIGTRVDDTTVEVHTNIISETPFSTVHEYTDELPVGVTQRQAGANGLAGAVVDVYRHILDGDGNLIEIISVGRTIYSTQNRVYLVGTLEPEYEPEPPPPPDEVEAEG